MALQITYTDSFGTTHPAAYGYLSNVTIRREAGQPQEIAYVVSIFASMQARFGGMRPVANVGGVLPIEDDSAELGLSAIYAHAKMTLPEFANAEDV